MDQRIANPSLFRRAIIRHGSLSLAGPAADRAFRLRCSTASASLAPDRESEEALRIRSLGPLAKLTVPALSLLLAGCGANNANHVNTQSGDMCSGCSFVYATTNTGHILAFPTELGGALGTAASTPGIANTPYISAPEGGAALYVSDPNNNAIDAFAVNSSDGALTAIAGSPFSLGALPGTPAGVVEFGNDLYVGDTNGTIAAFNIASSGSLTALAGSPFSAGVAPENLVVYNPGSIHALYAADFAGGGIWGFTIDSDGALAPVPGSPIATPPNSAPAAIAVNWTTIYVALSGLNEIAAYSVDGSGALAPVPGSPFMAGRGPASLVSYNSFLYALNGMDHTISAYSVDQNTGFLTAVPGSPFPAGTAVAGLSNGYDGVLYAPDTQSNSILAFSVDGSTGRLAPLAGSPFPTGVGPVALATVRFPILTPP